MVASDSAGVVDEAAALVALSASARVPDRGITGGIHALVSKIGLDGHTGLANTMLDAYAKGGGHDLGAARKLFDMMERDVVSWNTMIALYAQNGLSTEALGLYSKMLIVGGGVRCNAVTLSAVLLACAHAGAIQAGKRIHTQVSCFLITFDYKVPWPVACFLGSNSPCQYLKISLRDFAEQREPSITVRIVLH
jgi:pentatricopeptide repeat protein